MSSIQTLTNQLAAEKSKTLDYFRGMSKDLLQVIMLGLDNMGDREDARRWKLVAVAMHKEANAAVSPAPAVSPSEDVPVSLQNLSRERFFKLLYLESRSAVLNGNCKPTTSAVMGLIADTIRQHTQALGLQPSLIGKPERQTIAEKILEKLHQEQVLELSPDQGVGHPKYTLAARWR